MESSTFGFSSRSFWHVCTDGGAVQKPDKEIHAPHHNYIVARLLCERPVVGGIVNLFLYSLRGSLGGNREAEVILLLLLK